MAIVRVIEPNVPPTETADWGRMLELIRALELRAGDSNIVDWPSLVIPKNAVFFLGGTVYQADADTAISGTASSFVKLTPSSDGSICTASYVTSLTGVSWNTTYNGWYDADWNLYVFQAALPDRPHMARFESSGTFVVPLGIDTIYISGCAAGGNGSSPGGGGGGGECAIKQPLNVTPGESIAITIGAVGSNTTVGNGFSLNYGKNAPSGSDGGIGGLISSGNVRGGNGGSAGNQGQQSICGGGGGGINYVISGFGTVEGGGGGGGGYFGNGLNGSSGSGAGGGSAFCGGGGGGASNSLADGGGEGGAGGYGGGGGGGGYYGGTGGAGGPALIIIEW